jgi:chromosome partitioning protein
VHSCFGRLDAESLRGLVLLCLIVACVGQKGGIGKSTIAIALAAEGLGRGLKVLLVDGDRQATARTWAATAAEHERQAPTVIAMDHTMHRPGQLDRVAGGYDLTIIDCPARIGEVPASALMMADLAILPTGPSGADTWALAETLDLLEKARTLRPALRAVLVINKQTRTALGRGVREALAATGVPVLATELFSRVAYQEAINLGQGVAQYDPGSAAAAEVRRLFDEVMRGEKPDAQRAQEKGKRRKPAPSSARR